METITNKKYDELAEAIEEYMVEEKGTTFCGAELCEITNIVLSVLDMKKE